MSSATDRELSPFAAALRQARLAKSLSVPDLARLVQLSDTQVTGLESDDLGAFYGAAFALRAARRCAEYLGVDPSLAGAPVAAESVPVEAPPASLAPIRARAALSLKPSWIVAGLAGLVLVGGGVYLARMPRGLPPSASVAPVAPTPVIAEPVAAVVPEPVPAPAPETSAAPAAPAVLPAIASAVAQVPDDLEHRFYLVVTREVTIHARDASGTVVISGSLQAAPGQRVVGNPPFAVAVSDEDAVEIYYQGNRVRTERNNNQGVSLSVDPRLQER